METRATEQLFQIYCGATPAGAADTIAGWTVGGRYDPADTLPIEPAMGEELAVSRTVVREALKTLTGNDPVVTGLRLRTRVRPRSPQTRRRAHMNLLPGAFSHIKARFLRYLKRLMVFLLSAMVLMRRLRMAFGNITERELALPFSLLAGGIIASVFPASIDLTVLGRA